MPRDAARLGPEITDKYFRLDIENIRPGLGGSIWVSWGGPVEGTGRIEIWEPNRHLRLRQEDRQGVVGPVTVDYLLEGSGGRTVLRLVHSGFGAGADWDAEYDGTRRGWQSFLAVLKHDLERHRGEPCRAVTFCRPVAMSAEQLWKLMLSPACLLAEGSLAGLAAGERYRVRTALGENLDGVIRRLDPPGYLMATVESLHDALLCLYCETHGGQGFLTLSWNLYGPAVDAAAELRDRWGALLDAQLGTVAARTEAGC
ncbi:MAG TPA: SRPBCC domain-containing protein [Thermoanaerobaculia bacterium]|nr:SRPBCC domain-containing protein [Thermoanaerobaculia bacterium]